jgi:AcrR family transcriptional regulator
MPRKVDKKGKKEAIARAAMGVFRSTGYHRTRMADIAEASGVGKGTVYEYFRAKDEILRFSFDRYFEAFNQGVLGVVRSADRPGRQLIALVEFALSHVEAWREHCAVYMDYFSAARTSGDQLFSLADIYGVMRNLLKEVIEKGQACGQCRAEVDPEAAADLLISLYDGVVLHEVFERYPGTLSKVRTAAVQLITSGLLAHAGGQSDEEQPLA